MSKETQSVMSELYNQTFKEIKEGEIVKGTVVAINLKEAIVDIGFKSEGFVQIDEFRAHEQIKINSQIDVLIETIEDDDGRLILSRAKQRSLKAG